ncbi:diguanylate cyclase (GGDEF) domain-containing protein [Vibrio xiamenensis]|uniref:Diguanylate cyclase (GGDEF) domain-containing protein n=1 Tax=Vibrio xiamenensis TaxID=861298 RepID=A0A1G8DZE0_9VIBR|nr:bifunctional diguanylate cyclase/phosphodiesterase [Vibrio xiamenensis]SDH62809.1 diguanylate cyclase (GGDEF) domain-containing protein [Vibrio xiamenensis]
MERARHIDAQVLKVKLAVQIVFYLSIALITYTLVSQHQQQLWLYLAFPLFMTLGHYHQHPNVKRWCAVLSITVIAYGGWVDPLDPDYIEESFILLPLCYIVMFPGSLWPNAIVPILIATYLHYLPSGDYGEFFEDAFELAAITGLASVMMLFHKRYLYLASTYKQDSLTDYLTKLPNRKAFSDDIRHLSARLDYAVIEIGLNDFKNINDSLGYTNGDELLVKFGRHLVSLVADKGRVYRLGGDEFIILISSSKDVTQDVIGILDMLVDSAQKVFMIGNTSHRLTYSIGIALLSDALGDTRLWGKNAATALYKARSRGPNQIQWYDDELLEESIRQHQIEVELASAIEAEQFYLLYQPKVDVKQNLVLGAEALIRWQHPFLGMIPPNDFISIAEKTAQIVPIGRWVIRQACMQAKAWYDMNRPICISVNVSTVQFAHDEIDEYIKSVLDEIRLPPHLLQIEITETALMQRSEFVVGSCKKLREMGVSVAVDDFGVEYSSLNYLKQLPIDVLKIDKSFVDDCVHETTDHMLVRTIIQIGRNLGKRVVAEGVEYQEQLELLCLEGCDEYQGYYFSKPIDARAFTQLID